MNKHQEKRKMHIKWLERVNELNKKMIQNALINTEELQYNGKDRQKNRQIKVQRRTPNIKVNSRHSTNKRLLVVLQNHSLPPFSSYSNWIKKSTANRLNQAAPQWQTLISTILIDSLLPQTNSIQICNTEHYSQKAFEISEYYQFPYKKKTETQINYTRHWKLNQKQKYWKGNQLPPTEQMNLGLRLERGAKFNFREIDKTELP